MKKFLLFTTIILIISSFSILLYLSTRPQQEEHISGAYKALNFFSQQRAYPNNSIPDVSHYAAYEKVREKRKVLKERSFNTPPWETIGPHNTGGRTLAIAFNPQNPNTIYAGSASGGLWRSKTAGVGVVAWEYVPTGFPVLGVCSIDFAPGDSNTIYLGTGEVYNYQQAGTGAAYRSTRGSYGIGILKTTDGGQTWTKSLDWSYHQSRGVQVVRVNPLNPQTVWAGTTEGTYRSTNGGQIWQRVHDVIMVWDLVIHPVDTNIVIITCGNFSSTGYGMYRTTDSGSNWSKILQGVPTTFAGKGHLAISRSFPDVIYASIGNGFSTSGGGATWLCKSSDKGASWTIISTVDYSQWQGWFSHDVAVNPADTNLVITIGIGVWKSTNGGTTLIEKAAGGLVLGRPPIGGPEGSPNYVHADNHDIMFHPTDPNVFYLGTDGGVFRSLNAGDTFESCNGSYQTVQFYNGFSSSPMDSLLSLGGLQDNSTIIYDGQLAWIRVIGGDGSWTGINSLNDNILYGSSQNLNLRKSTNQGQNWFYVSMPSSSPTSFIAPYVVAYDNPQILYAGRDRIYKSINGGSSWTTTNNGLALDGNPAIAMAISPQNSDVVYVATAPFSSPRGVFRTIDGGSSWTNITANLPDRYPADLYVNPVNEANAYITFSGYGSPHVYVTNDYGNSWQNISGGLPDVPTSAVIVDPLLPDHIYVGNDIGVFVSVDGGSSWTDFNDGLPEAVMVFDLSISPTNRKLRVATHGNGAYERDLVEETVDISQGETPVKDYQLFQNYPNPFNPSTTIPYSLATRSEVSLSIYNSLGQKVKTLVNAIQPAGEYEAVWDGTNEQGIRVSSGLYLFRLNMAGQTKIKSMTLMR